MATRSTSRSYWRHKGSASATPAVAVQAVEISFDPTAASAALGVVLPKGAKVLAVEGYGGATGGTNPTVDIGTASDDDAFAAELDADAGFAQGSGADTFSELAADTEIYGGVGASAATGGTFVGIVRYIMADDQAEAS